MHPRGDFSSHYCVPGLTAAGYAVFGQRSRFPNHDTACVHEIVLAEVAAGVRYLKGRGFARVILAGNSGGAVYIRSINHKLERRRRRDSRTRRRVILSI
jgi:hypothetical protein